MKPTLDEWIEKYPDVKFLMNNLRANLDSMTDLSEDEKGALMRCNMIMVRQFAQSMGLE